MADWHEISTMSQWKFLKQEFQQVYNDKGHSMIIDSQTLELDQLRRQAGFLEGVKYCLDIMHGHEKEKRNKDS